MNEVYSRDISRKVSSALEVKQQRGEFIGSWPPYSYRKSAEDKHRLEPDPETAPVLKDIFKWRISGMGYLPIVRRLNELGIPSPSRLHYLRGELKSERFSDSIWHVPIVKMILRNEVYLGHLIQGRTKNDIASGRKLVPVPREQWVIVRNTHQPLIDENTFWAVQELAQECRAAHEESLGKFDSLGTIPNILKGLVFCADCKVPMSSVKAGGSMISYEPLWNTMKKRGATTYTLQAKGNISSSTIRRLKKGDSVSTNTLDALCKILDCTVNDILIYIPDTNA